ncbi:hypothetical protein [Methylogaea oryzae]|uniref:hypothetical protein n=1 Tax=Methylogaea oryzae TaxID=1295382 RepID=UPI001C3F1D89|nr:hypothetical protein [Methylogaea oryzae]
MLTVALLSYTAVYADLALAQSSVPVVAQIPTGSSPTPPPSSKVTCTTGPDSAISPTCPVIEYEGVKFWPFSYVDNRYSLNVAGYDAANRLVSQQEVPGTRYVWKVTVDTAAQTVTFFGQSNTTATLPWSKLTPPPVVTAVPVANSPTPPAGSKVSCMTGPNSPTPDGISQTCPVIEYQGLKIWPFSYVDNRYSINVAGYDAANKLVSQQELTGTRYIWKVTVDTTAQTVTFFGQSNTTATIPWSKLVPPVVASIPTQNSPAPPAGSKVACMTGPNSPSPDGISQTCPVVQYKGLNFWPFSYVDNRGAINVVGYDAANKLVSQQELAGTRYIWKVTVDANAQTVTFFGQSNGTVTIPWSKLSP